MENSSNIFYISIIIVASLFAQLSQTIYIKKGRNYGFPILILAYLIITLPVALRYNTGADYSSYVNTYEIVKAQGIYDPFGYPMEIGYILLNYICFKLFDDYQSVFIIMALLTNYFFFKGILYEFKKINLGLAVFAYGFSLYFWDYIIIRNMLGIAIIFYALRFIFEKKIIKYFLAVTIAVLFHYSLIIFYFIGIFYVEKFKKYRMPLAIISILIIPVIPNIINLFGTKLSLIWIQFSTYDSYLAKVKFGLDKYGIICALPLIPFSIFYKRLKKLNEHISLYFSFYIISIVLLLFSSEMPLMYRYVYALWPSQIILFSSLLNILGKRRKVIASLVILCIFIYGIVLINYFINNEIYYMLPYISIFQR